MKVLLAGCLRHFALLFAVLVSISVSAPAVLADDSAASGKAQTKIRALLVTGGCCHDYPRQIELIRDGLIEQLGPIDWTVAQYNSERTTEADVYDDPNWAKKYDIVVHNECFGGVENGPFVERIVQGHVGAGVPAVAIHCSMHSYRAAPTVETWRAFLGVTSQRHERMNRSLKVVPVKTDHPITQSFPKAWDTPNGELYIIEKVWPTATVLANAYSTELEVDMPVIWTNQYQGVRVFGITLGHHNETIAHEVWMKTVAAGIRWAMEDEPAADN